MIYCAKNKLPAGALTLSTGGGRVQQATRPQSLLTDTNPSAKRESVPSAFLRRKKKSGLFWWHLYCRRHPVMMMGETPVITIQIKRNLAECYIFMATFFLSNCDVISREWVSLCVHKMESWPCKFDELFLEAWWMREQHNSIPSPEVAVVWLFFSFLIFFFPTLFSSFFLSFLISGSSSSGSSNSCCLV